MSAITKYDPELIERANYILDNCIGDKCLRCVRECPLLKEYNLSPESICLSLTRDNCIDTLLAYSCTNCGLCKSVCPKNLGVNDILIPVRKDIVVQNGNKLPFKSQRSVVSHQIFSFSKPFTTKKKGE